MSYTYLLGQGVESSAESFSDIPAFVLSRSTPIAERCCSSDSGTECCQSSRSGTTCEPSTEILGEEESMLSPGDSLARTSALPDEAKGSAASEAGCGLKWPASSARYDRDSCSWRTSQLSLLGDSELYSETWPRWGLMHGGEFWALSTPAHLTSGSGFGYWPTPRASAAGSDFAKLDRSKTGISLQTAVRMFPTPTTQDAKNNGGGQPDDQEHEAAECGGWWTSEPDVGRMAHGVANRVDRLRAIGNGQVPTVAALAWRVLGGPVE